MEKQKQNLSDLKNKLKTFKDEKIIEKKLSNIEKKLKREKPASNSVKMEVTITPEVEKVANDLDIESGSIIKLTPKDLSDDKTFKLFKLTRQQFKNEKLNSHLNDISYVDIDKNTNKIYVRCKNKELANNLFGGIDQLLDGFNAHILGDKEESEYIRKISNNRDKKQSKVEKKAVRGKSKVSKVCKKIFFFFIQF